MDVTHIHATPLAVAAHGARTCWQSFDKSDNGGQKDLSLLDRVGNKNKHKSILEHLVFVVKINNLGLIEQFEKDSFANVSKVSPNEAIISFNMRGLQNMDIKMEHKKALVPANYVYLIDGDCE